VRTSPISAAWSPPGTERSAAERRLRGPGRHEGHQPALVGHVHRVDAEDLRRAGDVGPHGHVGLTDEDGDPGGPGELVEDRGDPAARRVAQAADVLSDRLQQRVHRRPQRLRVRLDLRAEAELAAGQHDRGPVLADRAGHEDAITGAQGVRGQARTRVAPPDAGGADVHPVGVASLDDLRVAAHDLHVGGARSGGDRLDLVAQRLRLEALLEDQRHGERDGPGPRDRQVVDGPVHGQLADRAAREAQRLDHEAVRRHRERRAVHLEAARVGQLFQRSRSERGHEQALDERARGLAPGPVGHRDALVAEARRLGPRRLDDPQDLLLTLGDRHTTSRSRANRP
jgi:hypothetical protein